MSRWIASTPRGASFAGSPAHRRPETLRRWAKGGALVCIAALAVFLRAPHLADRPMHGDEANQAFKAGILLETGRYVYDPQDHHGPTLYYATLPVAWALGRHTLADMTESLCRSVPLAFGIGVLATVALLAEATGWGAALIAMALLAISPSMVFYSRYYIQEMLLVFFTAMALGCGWRHVRARGDRNGVPAQDRGVERAALGWAIAFGASLGLMHATKETCVLAFAAMAIAGLAVVWRMPRRMEEAVVSPGRRGPSRATTHLVAAVVAALAVSALFFSSFGSHPRGILDSALAYAAYFHRLEEAGPHTKPWHYYLGLLTYNHYGRGPVWSEAVVVLLALAGIVRAWRDRAATRPAAFMQFLAIYAIALLAIYSAIPYKTPWCVLSSLYPLALLAGYGAAGLWRVAKGKVVRAAGSVLLALAVAHLLVQDMRATGRYAAHPANPYVYAHTSGTFMKLVERIDSLAAIAPEGKNLAIRVMVPPLDYWPLPWHLRKYSRVGYWANPPDEVDAAIVVVAPAYQADVERRMKAHYAMEYHGVRPGVIVAVYVEAHLWKTFLRNAT